ncbi:hypothetical protein ALC57_06335 [Trachymyrmex cornetzi]|uniref:Uncharacterized protein n=1 Tax=Trachymyrmex cornetzi TaxID=471704 RepID=A0A195E9A8_9HYME|nr:hypothetical protein ALC57_06335 [Trachymyrmex cornetzi]
MFDGTHAQSTKNKKQVEEKEMKRLRGTLGTIYPPISNSRMNSNDLHSLLESLFSFCLRRVDSCVHMHPDNLDRFANCLEITELRRELHDADVGYVGDVEQFCPREIERSQKPRASEHPVLETRAHGRNREDFRGHETMKLSSDPGSMRSPRLSLSTSNSSITDLMLSSRDFFRLIVEGACLPGNIPFKIFTCVQYRLSCSQIGGAVLLVGIRRVEGRMYKTGIAWNWTVCGGDEESTDDGSGSPMFLRSVWFAVALRRLWSATEFGM